MPENMISELIGNAPGLAGVILVAWMFLRHQKTRDELFTDALHQIESRHHKACEETTAAMNQNTETIQRATETIGQSAEVIRRAESAIARMEREREHERRSAARG